MEGVLSFVFGVVGLESVKVETDIFAKGGRGKKWRETATRNGHSHCGG